MVKQSTAAIVVPQAIKTFRTSQDASRIFLTVWNLAAAHRPSHFDPWSTNDKTRFARLSGTTKSLREQVHTMLVDKSQDAVRRTAKSLGNVEDVIALP